MATVEQMAEDYIAETGMALCGVMEMALVEKGVPPVIARALSERACKPAARQGARTTVQTVQKNRQRRAKSAYSRKYKAAFKRIAPKYKLKSGKWKKGGIQGGSKGST